MTGSEKTINTGKPVAFARMSCKKNKRVGNDAKSSRDGRRECRERIPMSKRFTAVNALLVSTTRTKKGGFAKVKFQLTPKVTKALEWPEMPEGTAEWCPDVDELQAELVEFTPNNDEMKSKATSINANTIGDFIVVRKKKKAGKNSVRADKVITEVICTIKFSDPIGCANLEQYILGAARSEMLVVYTPQAVQEEMPLVTEEQQQAVLDMPEGEGEKPEPERKPKRGRILFQEPEDN
jgi:hypothetical protein